MNREDRQRVLARMYANFARLRTGDNTGQMMTIVKIYGEYAELPWPQLAGGQLDAPEWLPAGSMCSDWQRECRRP